MTAAGGRPPATTGPTSVVGAVLTGGASRRFGTDKALTMANGRPLAMVAVTAMRDAGIDPVVTVGGSAGAELAVPAIGDRRPGEGPLAALATVLLWARRGLVVVTPCDLPLLTGAHLAPLIAAADEHTAAVAVVAGRPEPSVACWPARWGPTLNRAVNDGERAWRAALDLGPWEAVVTSPDALADADTPEALDRLLRVDRPETG